jgi:hypothetical protein
MTTQEKTAAIQKIVGNRQDNRAAIAAAGVDATLVELANEALNDAFKEDLRSVFVLKQQ